MSDIKLAFGSLGGDVVLQGMDLARDDGLETAIVISLFTDRRCSADQLPDNETDQRGFWGDAFAMLAGDQTGSLLWLLAREKTINAVLARAKDYAADALKWLLEDKVAAALEIETEYVRRGVLAIAVRVIKPSGDALPFRYEYAWLRQAESQGLMATACAI